MESSEAVKVLLKRCRGPVSAVPGLRVGLLPVYAFQRKRVDQDHVTTSGDIPEPKAYRAIGSFFRNGDQAITCRTWRHRVLQR